MQSKLSVGESNPTRWYLIAQKTLQYKQFILWMNLLESLPRALLYFSIMYIKLCTVFVPSEILKLFWNSLSSRLIVIVQFMLIYTIERFIFFRPMVLTLIINLTCMFWIFYRNLWFCLFVAIICIDSWSYISSRWTFVIFSWIPLFY